MSQRPTASEQIRSNVLANAVCFAALTGTAVAATSGGEGPDAESAASATKQVKKLKSKVKSLAKRLAALEGPRPAGGELSGTYPNPSIGAVSGLDLASSTSPAGGINFGADVNLYRAAGAFLRTDDGFQAGGGVTFEDFVNVDGLVTLGDSVGDEVRVTGWLRMKAVSSAPVDNPDCDSAGEAGRVVYNTNDNLLYVCDGGGGWRTAVTS